MKINNKEFREWTADDLQVLLNNDAYRENNFIDYKVNFAPLIDKDKKREKQAEFRNDVCSFANADGGYIFFGIGESSGAASILAGISFLILIALNWIAGMNCRQFARLCQRLTFRSFQYKMINMLWYFIFNGGCINHILQKNQKDSFIFI